jgi:DNA-binding protein H-NS
MATYADVKRQIAKLEKQAETLFRNEIKEAVAAVKELIARYELTAEDLGLVAKRGQRGTRNTKAPKAKSGGAPMYRDPKSGKTWTGRGKPPNWIAGAKNREAFLIAASSVSVPADASPQASAKSGATKKPKRAAAKAAVKAAGKPAAKKAAQPAVTPKAKPVAGKKARVKAAPARKSSSKATKSAGAAPTGSPSEATSAAAAS